MKTTKISLANIQGKLSRIEMKNIMAGLGDVGSCGSNCNLSCTVTCNGNNISGTCGANARGCFCSGVC